MFVGINPPECYESIWKGVGCLEEGYANPNNLTVEGLRFLYDLNIW